MKINNSFSPQRIKKALSPQTVLIVFLLVAVLSVLFYITIENYDSREVMIWFVTTDAEAGFSDGVLKNINDYGTQNGIDRVLLLKRHPEDRYFDAVMSTSAFYTCDIFIMQEDLALKYAEMGMFLPLSDDGVDEEKLLYASDTAVGIKLDDNYYFLINERSEVDQKMIYDIYKMLVEK